MTDREKLIELLVEAESLCAAIDCYDGAVCEYAGEVNGCTAFRADHLIANGVVVRKKGEWELYPSSEYRRCRVCKTEYEKARFNVRANFCPNCGSDMRGEQ